MLKLNNLISHENSFNKTLPIINCDVDVLMRLQKFEYLQCKHEVKVSKYF